MHLAVARPLASDEYWYVISDEPTDVQSLEEYGLRFDIEENFLDDKSNGFQLESSLIRSSEALERLCFVLAMTTLYLCLWVLLWCSKANGAWSIRIGVGASAT